MLHLTPLGWILVPIALWIFTFRSRADLFWAFALSTVLFGARVGYVAKTGTIIPPHYLFGALFVVKEFLCRSLYCRWSSTLTRSGVVWTALVVVVLTLSWCGLIAQSGKVDVSPMGTEYWDWQRTPLQLTSGNLTQLAFPLFGVTLLILSIEFLRSKNALRRLGLLGGVACALVVVSGLIYMLAGALGYKGILRDAFWLLQGHGEVRQYGHLVGSVPRMVSLAGEPGYTSALLLLLTGPVAMLSGRLWAHSSTATSVRPQGLGAMVALGGSLVITGSTTAFLGVVLFAFSLGLLAVISAIDRRSEAVAITLPPLMVIGLVVTILSAVAMAVVLQPAVAKELAGLIGHHIDKLEGRGASGSGGIRMRTVLDGLEVASSSPIVGVGYGSHRTASMLVSLLANVGVMGTFLLLTFHGSILVRTVTRMLRAQSLEEHRYAYALSVSHLVILPTYLIGKSMVVFNFGWYWIFLAANIGFLSVSRGYEGVGAAQSVYGTDAGKESAV